MLIVAGFALVHVSHTVKGRICTAVPLTALSVSVFIVPVDIALVILGVGHLGKHGLMYVIVGPMH